MAFQGNAFQGNAFQIPRATLIATFKNIFRPLLQPRSLAADVEVRACAVDETIRTDAVEAENRGFTPEREDRTTKIEG